ncbi:MAG: periplasmic heavy metal sensor [Planctomycetaceae bacterium]|jgi:hypothetical protein|nr:periplasmic heavy metal sensor [Planctomycetaceae bacterium]
MSGRNRGYVRLRESESFARSKQSAETSWQPIDRQCESECQSIDRSRSGAEEALNIGEPPEHANKLFQLGKNYQKEAEELQQQARQHHADAWNTVKPKKDASKLEKQAVRLLNQAADRARDARTAFEQVKVIIEQKQEADRQRELKRTAAANALQSAKSEIDGFDINELDQWSNDPALLDDAQKKLQTAAQKLESEHFEESQTLTAQAVESFRQLYEKSMENKKQVGNRNIITKAIVDALKELQYDTPAVNYVPQEGEKNPKLGDITIVATTPSGSGDMRIIINRNGDIDLNLDNIPEGEEKKCHQIITDLQTNVATVADFTVKDWGRGVAPPPDWSEEPIADPSTKPKTRVKVTETAKQRNSSQ